MIAQMSVIYRSKDPCHTTPTVFTTGTYAVKKDGLEFRFDFTDMGYSIHFENDHLFIESTQIHLDYNWTENLTPETLEQIFRNLEEKDLSEIFYECFADSEESMIIELIPLRIAFIDYEDADNPEIVVFDKT